MPFMRGISDVRPYLSKVRPPTAPSAVFVDATMQPSPPYQFPQLAAMVVLCGSPGSGKSALVRSHGIAAVQTTEEKILPFDQRGTAHLFVAVSTDVLGTVPRCKKKAKEALLRGRGVVVDNTNRTLKNREVWYEIAHACGAPAICVYLPRVRNLVEHLDGLRVDHPNHQERKEKRLPSMALSGFANNFEPPNAAGEPFAGGLVPVFVEQFAFNPAITPQAHFDLWHS